MKTSTCALLLFIAVVILVIACANARPMVIADDYEELLKDIIKSVFLEISLSFPNNFNSISVQNLTKDRSSIPKVVRYLDETCEMEAVTFHRRLLLKGMILNWANAVKTFSIEFFVSKLSTRNEMPCDNSSSTMSILNDFWLLRLSFICRIFLLFFFLLP